MRLGIIVQDIWHFFNDIYANLDQHYQTGVFTRRHWQTPFFYSRINRILLHYDLQSFMRSHDVVFFEWASELLAVATHLPKTCGIITRLHRYEMYEWVDKINWDAVDKIILVSKAKELEFVSRFPAQASKTIVFPPSIALQKFEPGTKTYHGDIGILCNLSPRKRVYDLILAFFELTKLNNGFHLHIAGGAEPANTDYYESLCYIVSELNLQDKVSFYGSVKDTWNWYQKIDIFISNSYSEGLQVAPMEAMASGCYCLSHRWSGAEELLPNDNLYYTNSELIKMILQYNNISESEKQNQRTRMRIHACENFNVDDVIKQLKTLINEVAIQ